jgi:hypothetical protein
MSHTLSRDRLPDRLLKAKESATGQLLSMEEAVAPAMRALAAVAEPRRNVVGVGIGRKLVGGRPTTRTAIRIYVERKIAPAALGPSTLLPRDFGGIPTDVVQTGRFLALPARVPAERRRLRPARPGCSVGFQFSGDRAGYVMAGTLGALVERDGKRLVLSNNHVLADENSLPIGAPIFQPGLLDGGDPAKDQIARLSEFVTLRRGAANRVDAAVAELLDPGLASPSPLPPVGKLRSGEPLPAAEGLAVEKVGRTTGHTTGRVFDVSADVRVGYDLGTLVFADQILIAGDRGPFSAGGDSGSLIVARGKKRPVGLLFAGSESHTIANHAGEVLTALRAALLR